MAAAALVTLSSSLTGRVQTVDMALAMMALLMFAHGFWITNYVTLISDRFPTERGGHGDGLCRAWSAPLGGILANFRTGWIVDRYSATGRSGSPRAACIRWPWWSCC